MIISRKEIVSRDMKKFKPFVNDLYWGRMNRKRFEHYRFLAWVADQYNDCLFWDLGTRAGASAMCLASNPTNRVISCDISPRARKYNKFDFSQFRNIEWRISDVRKIKPHKYDDAKIIFLDIDHTGDSERKVLERVEQSQFSGILIIDDIDCHKFPAMKIVWEEITRPKLVVPYAHKSGTGVVSYGPEIIGLKT